MNDIEAPQFYDAQNIDLLVAELHKHGLYNLSELIKNQFEEISNHESEIEEAVEAANDQSYQSGYDDAMCDRETHGGGKAEEFASWFLREFEPESKKKLKFKMICGTNFVILTESDYDELKNQFHKMCD